MVDDMVAAGLRWRRRHGAVALVERAVVLLLLMLVMLLVVLVMMMLLDAGQSGQLLQRDRAETWSGYSKKKRKVKKIKLAVLVLWTSAKIHTAPRRRRRHL